MSDREGSAVCPDHVDQRENGVPPVRMHVDEDWARVPDDLKRRFEAGVERIRILRDKIGAEARVTYMPPIAVVAAGWSSDGKNLIHGMAGAWRDNNNPGRHAIGVLLSAGPALCEDDVTVRAILAHEFGHCFKIATVIVDHNDLGTSLDILRGDPMDQTREELMLPNPTDWFGQSDVSLLQWGDERLQPATEEVHELVRQQRIPGEQPPRVERASFAIPEEWKAHIRSIRQSA
jgi:hypothetical protein